MAIDGKRLSEAALVTTDGVEEARRRAVEKHALQAGLLAMASVHCGLLRRWHVLTVANRCEKAVEKRLGEADVEACAPVRKVAIQCRRLSRKRERLDVVFAGYVFVKVADEAHVWAGLTGVKDVRGVLCAGGRPGVVGEEMMRAIKALAEEGHFDRKEVARRYAKGERVTVNVGRFAGLEGVFEGYRDGRAARVRAVLFGGEQVIDVPLARIAKFD